MRRDGARSKHPASLGEAISACVDVGEAEMPEMHLASTDFPGVLLHLRVVHKAGKEGSSTHVL